MASAAAAAAGSPPATTLSAGYSAQETGGLGGRGVAGYAAASEKPDAPEAKGLSNKRLHGGWVATAIAIVALLAGAVGALAYMGHLNVTLAGVGTLSQTLGLYTALGGLGVFALAIAAIACNCCNWNAAKAGDKPRNAERVESGSDHAGHVGSSDHADRVGSGDAERVESGSDNADDDRLSE